MRRDKQTVLDLLTVLVDLPWLGGVSLPALKASYTEKHGQFEEKELYSLNLLIDSGILLKKDASEYSPASVLMTWTAHNILDELGEQRVTRA